VLPTLQIGPAVIQTSVLLLLTGVWLATGRIEKHARLRGQSGDRVLSFLLSVVASGIVAGRLAYAAQHPLAYLADPLGLISPTAATLNLEASALAALAAGVFVLRRWARKGQTVPFLQLLDVLTPGLAVMMIALSADNLASGTAYGAPARLPWSIFLWGEWRHPSQAYELLAALAFWLAIERLARSNATAAGAQPGTPTAIVPGFLFFAWLAMTAGARLMLEVFRGGSLMWGGGIRAAQIVALVVLLGALWVLGRVAQGRPSASDAPPGSA